MPRHDMKAVEALYREAETLFLRGFSYGRIGKELGISRARAQQLCKPCRKLVDEGGYQDELARLRARGITGLPDEPQKIGGRPRVVLSSEDMEIREDYGTLGLGFEAIARKHDRKISYIRAVLERTPNLIELRRKNLYAPKSVS